MNRIKLKEAMDKAQLNAAKIDKQYFRALNKLLTLAARVKKLRSKSHAAQRRATTAEALYRDSWRRQATPPAEAEQPN